MRLCRLKVLQVSPERKCAQNCALAPLAIVPPTAMLPGDPFSHVSVFRHNKPVNHPLLQDSMVPS